MITKKGCPIKQNFVIQFKSTLREYLLFKGLGHQQDKETLVSQHYVRILQRSLEPCNRKYYYF